MAIHCPNCKAMPRPQYVFVPKAPHGNVSDTEPRDTEYCPFCGTEVQETETKDGIEVES